MAVVSFLATGGGGVETEVHVGDNVQVRACPVTSVSDLLARLQVFAQGNHVIDKHHFQHSVLCICIFKVWFINC